MKQDDQAKQAMAALQGKVLGTNPLNIKEVKRVVPGTSNLFPLRQRGGR